MITWQAFEPPIDLSQDLDGCEGSNLECAPNEKYILDERHDSSCQPALTNNCTYHQEESKSLNDSVTGTLSTEVRSRHGNYILSIYNLLIYLYKCRSFRGRMLMIIPPRSTLQTQESVIRHVMVMEAI